MLIFHPEKPQSVHTYAFMMFLLIWALAIILTGRTWPGVRWVGGGVDGTSVRKQFARRRRRPGGRTAPLLSALALACLPAAAANPRRGYTGTLVQRAAEAAAGCPANESYAVRAAAARPDAVPRGALDALDEEEAYVIGTANTTAWTSAQRLLEEHDVDTWLLQETKHVDELEADQATAWAKRRGWKLAAGNGLEAKAGARAGADVASSKGVTQGRWPGLDSHELWPGRCTAVHLSAVARGGIAVASVYCAVGTGMKGDNVDLCDKLEECVDRLDCLWVIGGDWNMEAGMLREFAARLGGVVVSARGTTCTAGKGSNIDYFVVHAALGPLVRAVICDDGLIKTHRVVKLLINAASRRLTQLEIVGEKAFPVDMPVGPMRQPVPFPGWAAGETLEAQAARWYRGAEEELLRLFDMNGTTRAEVRDADKHRGRGSPAVYRPEAVLKKSSCEVEKTSPAIRAGRALGAVCNTASLQLRNDKRFAARETGLAAARRRAAWMRDGLPEFLGDRLRNAQTLDAGTWAEIGEEVWAWVATEESALSDKGCQAWRTFAREACEGTAAIGHRLSKSLATWEHEEPDRDLLEEGVDADPLGFLPHTSGDTGPSGRGPDARAEHELRKWEKLWQAVPSEAAMPSLEWPEECGAPPEGLTAEMLRKASASFKRHTDIYTHDDDDECGL
jgi:hypothetical protein